METLLLISTSLVVICSSAISVKAIGGSTTQAYVVSVDPLDNSNGSWATMTGLVSLLSSNGLYGTAIRPKHVQSEALDVSITFHMNAIIDFSTANQKMDIMGYFLVEWKDEILPWDPVIYGNMNTVTLPKTLLWYPRLVIEKTYGTAGIVGDTTDMLKVNADGTVKWAPNGIYSLVCDVDTMFYPFDVQTCDMNIYVSDHTSAQVALHSTENAGVFLKEFTENVEWKLINIFSFSYVKYGTHFVTIRLVAERRASFTVYTMMIPLFTLSLLCVTSYLVPVQSGEKISLTITIFLTYGFFVAVTRDSIPPDSLKTPYIVRYISAMMILSMLSVMYVMVESKIFTSMGSKECRIGRPGLNCLLSKMSSLPARRSKVVNMTPNNQVKTGKTTRIEINELGKKQSDGTESGNKKRSVNRAANDSQPENIRYTYEDLLSHADIFMFSANLVVLLILNAVIWGLVLTSHEA